MNEKDDRSWFEENEDVQAWIPYEEGDGIRFKYSSLYRTHGEKVRTFGSFSMRYEFPVPPDFIELVDDHVEGGFDGAYRVAMDGGNRIAWWKFFFADLTVVSDEMLEAIGRESYVDHVIAEHRSLFVSPEGTMRFVPFGKADRFGPSDEGSPGFLAFDRAGRVFFLAPNRDAPLQIAESFREMLIYAIFMHYG
ncbi:MAG: hypothetical protein MUF31_01640 [Akkermansiaceae bacterium]|jgi:hypothetical protein|nr:hypothetical protein [Akkermansiaceae bacterium]